MTKWLIAAAATVIVAIPVATAASPNQDKPKPATAAQAQSADNAAAKACKAERQSLGVEAFNKKYGTNHNLKNAFGKCVSGKSKAKKDDKDEKDEDERRGFWSSREGLQVGARVDGCGRLRQEVRDEPEPEERIREVRVGQVEVERGRRGVGTLRRLGRVTAMSRVG